MTPARSPIGPTGGAGRDPVHEAEFEFLFELSQGRDAPPFGADMKLERIQDRARQRSRKAGRAEWVRKVGWVLTDAGRAWLAALPTPLATTEAGR